jgi:hypothetical protein
VLDIGTAASSGRSVIYRRIICLCEGVSRRVRDDGARTYYLVDQVIFFSTLAHGRKFLLATYAVREVNSRLRSVCGSNMAAVRKNTCGLRCREPNQNYGEGESDKF